MSENARNGNTAPDWGINYGIRELWSEIVPGLWVGGTADEDTVGHARSGLVSTWNLRLDKAEITRDDFDAVVTLYAWAQPVDWEVEELRWGIYDDPNDDTFDDDTMAETVAWAYRRWQAGRKVLIRCQAGLNRSSLVAAMVLIKDGYEPQQAIDLIRRNRARQALFNEGFVRYLHAQGQVGEGVA